MESLYFGTGGRGDAHMRSNALLALSSPDRAHAGPKSPSKGTSPSDYAARPASAPATGRTAGGDAAMRMLLGGVAGAEGEEPSTSYLPARIRQYGRLSLYDREDKGTKEAHEYLGPRVTRDVGRSLHGFANKGPDRYLKKGEASSLRTRVKLKELLATYPVNRDPPFRKGTGGVRLSFESVPSANSIFRHLYDNSTIDFCSVRWGVGSNKVVWGRQVRPGYMSWGDKPTEVEVARWLPIFLEGIREYEEPYRFLSIMGSWDLVEEGGSQLHLIAEEMVSPLKKALDTREPSVVALAVELIKAILTTDRQVALVWIHHLWQFCQVFNLFLSRGYLVNRGYNKRQVWSIKSSIQEVLILLQEHGGEDALAFIRRYCRTDPAVTELESQKRAQRMLGDPNYKPWKQFTLI